MNKARKRKQQTPFNELTLRDQWRKPEAKKSLVGCLVTFGDIRNPELTDGNGD